MPIRTRKPASRSSLTFSPPNRTRVVGAPSTPAKARGVPDGLLVTSGGGSMPRVHHRSSSASAQTRPAGPHGPPGPHGLQVQLDPHVPVEQLGPVPLTVGGRAGRPDGDGAAGGAADGDGAAGTTGGGADVTAAG